MRHSLTTLLFLTFFSAAFSQAFDWEWLHPQPTGQGINDAIILPNGQFLLFGDGGTIMRSTNSGSSWIYLYPDSLNGNRSIYEADFIDGNIGFICGVGGFIYKTTDGGFTWTEQTSGVTSTLWYIAFYDANTGYAVGDAAKLLKTTDGGSSWNPISLAAATGVLYNINIVPNTNGTTLYLATTSATIGRLAKSTDSGNTWAPVSGYSSTSSVRSLCFANPDTGFAGNFAHQIWRTTDGGTTFTQVSGAWGTGTMYEVKSVGTGIFAAAGNKGDVFITTDYGNTWSNNNNSYPSNVFSLSVAGNLNNDDDPIIVSAGEGGSIATSSNLGTTWNRLAVLETINELRNVQFVTANTGYAVGGSISTTSLAGDILKTSNGGGSWTKLSFDPLYRIKALYCLNENICFMASRGPNGLYRTTDGGATFDSINTGIGLAAYNWNAIDFADANTGYIVGDNGNYGKTTDGGLTWTVLPAASHHGASIIYDLSILDVNNVVSLGAAGKVYKTTDGGVTFLSINIGTTSAMYGIDFLNSNLGMLVGSTGRAYKTTDGGLSWVLMNTGAGTTTLYGIKIINENIAWMSGSAGSVYYTVNGGDTWVKSEKIPVPSRTFYEVSTLGNNLYISGTVGTILKGFADPNIPVELTSFTAEIVNGSVSLTWQTATELNNSGFEIERSNNKSLWVKIGFLPGSGTTTAVKTYNFVDPLIGSGIYFYRLKQIDSDGSYTYSPIVEVDLNIPFEFSLSQNYPNPFNPATTIDYSIGMPVAVTLKIFNTLGEEIAVLVNENQNPGRYSVPFNAAHLASGIYFYQLDAGDFRSVKKLLLMK